LERALGLPAPAWSIDVGAASKNPKAAGVKVDDLNSPQTGPLSFRAADAALPPAPPPADATPRPAPASRVLRVTEINADKFTLLIDGKPVVTAAGAEWGKGVAIDRGPEFEFCCGLFFLFGGLRAHGKRDRSSDQTCRCSKHAHLRRPAFYMARLPPRRFSPLRPRSTPKHTTLAALHPRSSN